MKATHFDSLLRSLTTAHSRRSAVQIVSGLVFGSAAGAALRLDAAAKKCGPCREKKRGRCKKKKPNGRPCGECRACQGGKCVFACTDTESCLSGDCCANEKICLGGVCCSGEQICANNVCCLPTGAACDIAEPGSCCNLACGCPQGPPDCACL